MPALSACGYLSNAYRRSDGRLTIIGPLLQALEAVFQPEERFFPEFVAQPAYADGQRNDDRISQVLVDRLRQRVVEKRVKQQNKERMINVHAVRQVAEKF